MTDASATAAPGRPDVHPLLHEPSSTISYIVADPTTRQCAVVDAALDFDLSSGRTSTGFADRIIARVNELGLECQWILETHVHADHLSAAPYVRDALGGRIAIGAHIDKVQTSFSKIYNLGDDFASDGSQFDHLFEDGEQFAVGSIHAVAMNTPGHTPACMTFVIGDAAFSGDTIFMPDFGTARCDFPGGSAHELFRSARRLLELPPETRIFVAHDYGGENRGIAWETTVAEQRAQNKHVRDGISEDEFVRMRTERDAQLSMPGLLLPSIQVNIRAGEMPPEEDNGVSYLKLPINQF